MDQATEQKLDMGTIVCIALAVVCISSLVVYVRWKELTIFSTKKIKVSGSVFDEEIIWNAWKVSKAVYEDSDRKQQTALRNSGIATFSPSTKYPTGQKYLIAFTEKYAMIGFMGTNSIKDWFTNINITQVNVFDGQLHRGFYQRAETVPLEEILLLAKNRQIYFVGHSLGGAVAQICTLLCLTKTSDISILNNIFCITFGSPFIGTAAIQDFVSIKRGDLVLDDHFLTIVNENDIVPGLLNLALSLSKTIELFGKYGGYFDAIMTYLHPPLAIATSTLKVLHDMIVKIPKDIQTEYKPIGAYKFLEVVDNSLKLSLTRDKDLIYKKVSTGVELSAKNVEHHNLWKYESNLSVILKIDNLKFLTSEPYILPDALILFKGVKDADNMEPEMLKFFLIGLRRIHIPGTIVLIQAATDENFRRLSLALFRLGIQKVVCFASPFQFLVEKFNSTFGENFSFNESTLKYCCAAPIVEHKICFPASQHTREIFKADTVEAAIFSCTFSRFFPKDIYKNYLTPEQLELEWKDNLEKKFLSRENIALFRGGVVVIRDRSETMKSNILWWVRRCIRLYRVRKERKEYAKKVAELHPDLFLVAAVNKPVQLALNTFGNMMIVYENEAVTISRMTEIIAGKVREDVTALKCTHEAAVSTLLENQRKTIGQFWDTFTLNQGKIGADALQKQQDIVHQLKERVQKIYNAPFWSSDYYHQDRRIDLAFNEQESALANISKDQERALQELHKSHIEAMKTLEQNQSLEARQLQEKWEVQRVKVLKDNQINYVKQAAFIGGAIACVTSIFSSVVTETHKYYYDRKNFSFSNALQNTAISGAKGFAVGGLSGALVTLIETTAEILPPTSFMKGVLAGNGGAILSAGIFSIDMLSVLYRWSIGEVTTEAMTASIITKSAQFGGSVIGSVLAYALAAAASTNPVAIGTAVLLGSIIGNMGGLFAGNLIDKQWLHSQDAALHKAYDILGISRDASMVDANKAYKQLALRYHPDKTNHLPKRELEEAKHRFLEVNLAIETIRNYEYLKAQEQQVAK